MEEADRSRERLWKNMQRKCSQASTTNSNTTKTPLDFSLQFFQSLHRRLVKVQFINHQQLKVIQSVKQVHLHGRGKNRTFPYCSSGPLCFPSAALELRHPAAGLHESPCRTFPRPLPATTVLASTISISPNTLVLVPAVVVVEAVSDFRVDKLEKTNAH